MLLQSPAEAHVRLDYACNTQNFGYCTNDIRNVCSTDDILGWVWNEMGISVRINSITQLSPKGFSTLGVQTKDSWILIWQTLLTENVVVQKLKVLEAQLKSLNRPSAMLYDLSYGGKVERLLLHPFSEREPFVRGSHAGFTGFFSSQDVFECQENVQKVSWDSDRWFGFSTRANFDDSSKSASKQRTISATRIYSIVKTTWTSWMGFGPVEWSGWGLVVIPSSKWRSGKKSDIFDEYCPRNLYVQFLHF